MPSSWPMDSPTFTTTSNDRNSSERPRTPLSSRLQALFANDGSGSRNASGSSLVSSTGDEHSPRSSLEIRSSAQEIKMWRSRAQRSSSSALNNVSNVLDNPRFQSPKRTLPNASSSDLPVLRWFGKVQELAGTSEPIAGPSSSPSSTPSTPRSALREALEDDIILTHSPWLSPQFDAIHPRRPPPVQLPPCAVHSGRIPMLCSPPFLDSLARSALPTASVTHPPPVFRHPSGHSIQRSETETYIDVAQSPPSRTSLDTLRSLRDRGITIAPGPPGSSGVHSRSFSTGPSLGPTRWFWNKELKEDVDQLLDETDQRDTLEGEQAHIRQKCLSHFRIYFPFPHFTIPLHSLLLIASLHRFCSKAPCCVLPWPAWIR